MALFSKVKVVELSSFDVTLKGDVEWCKFLYDVIVDIKGINPTHNFSGTRKVLNDRSKFKLSASKLMFTLLSNSGIKNDIEVIESFNDIKFVQKFCNLVCTFYEEE